MLLSKNYERDDNYRVKNVIDFTNEFVFLKNAVIGRFEWNGSFVEKFAQPDFIERTLFNYGLLLGATHPVFDSIILPAVATGYNIYNEPTNYRISPLAAVSEYVQRWDVPKDEAAILVDNSSCMPPMRVVSRYADKTSDCQRTEEVYVRGLKSPNIIVISETSNKTAKIIEKQIKDNREQIVLFMPESDSGELPVPTALDTGRSPEALKYFTDYRRLKFNECLNLFGLAIVDDGVAANKWTSTAKVDSHSIFANSLIKKALKLREQFCERFNALTGEDLSVKLNDIYEEHLESLKVENENKDGE